MSLAEFIAIIGGALTQLGFFYVNNGQNPFDFLKKKDEDEALVTSPISNQQLVLLFGGITLVTGLILDQFVFGAVRLRWVDDFFTYVIAAIFAFILFAALAGDKLLPRINEQQMLVIHLVVGINLFINGEPVLPDWAFVLLLIPTAALIFQGIWPRVLPTIQRAFFYLWYLITLVALAFQNGGADYFKMVETSVSEIFIFGSLLVFLGMHILVVMRFVLIISSLILPRNRPLLEIIMPNLVHDDQLSLPALLIILLVASGILGLNAMSLITFDQTLINLFVLAMLQLPKDFSLLWQVKRA